MVATRSISPRPRDVVLLVGTLKGAFLFRSDASRRRFERGGPFFAGQPVYAMAYDGRAGRSRLWAAPESSHWGAELCFSDDFGRTWTQPEAPLVRFPEDAGASLKRIWQIAPALASQPDAIYCGVEPAALFESRDAGRSFALVRGLWEHPHRQRWEPGFGGLCLHTVLPDPSDARGLLVAVSSAGAYRSDDGGATWRTSHQGVRADFKPDKYPEFGQCVHKVARAAGQPQRLYLQNHWGLYRSDDGGRSWRDVANGVPSDFGFALAADPHDPDTAYIVPLESDLFRCTPEGRLRVYRTRDGGAAWRPLSRGLPQKDAFETVLRDALCTDSLSRTGVYFGTRSGKLFASSDGGESWSCLADGLPSIVCVKTAVLADAAPRRRA